MDVNRVNFVLTTLTQPSALPCPNTDATARATRGGGDSSVIQTIRGFGSKVRPLST